MIDQNAFGALKDIANTKLWVMIVLTIVTLGVFPLMWAYKTQDEFNDELGAEIVNPKLFIALAIIFAVMDIFAPAVAGLVGLGALGIWVYWSWKMAEAIRKYCIEVLGFDYSVNMFLAVIFQYFYIVYLVNHLPEEYALKQKLAEVNAAHQAVEKDEA